MTPFAIDADMRQMRKYQKYFLMQFLGKLVKYTRYEIIILMFKFLHYGIENKMYMLLTFL